MGAAEADVARQQHKLVQAALGNTTPPLPFNQIQYTSTPRAGMAMRMRVRGNV